MASPAEQRVRVRLQRNEWVAPTGEEAFCAQPIAPATVSRVLDGGVGFQINYDARCGFRPGGRDAEFAATGAPQAAAHEFASQGILDMFGFEDSKPSQLEQLCINLCSETMQHFYNTHTLKTAIETCRDEGISCGVEVDYADNAHCIDLISSLVSINFHKKGNLS